ncbi:DUF4255 domain-containing protein [Microbulbifer rhizosphaerae]|uniref:Pvc16 N-terminal domain-containing protein n=1 Tax=Microbulbifer rhizosphaerae TaxID=1562603 RepID=A0A7W4WF83_9GAMM|nr:DUF4255 domain-containing protein [Microbulbifer rhizosphaerae]MBB3063138.1 hypothetical protein [Microbulbifer rhizosphaerae]
MADFNSIAAVSSSIVRFLDLSFRELQPIAGRNTPVRLLRTRDLDPENSALITLPSLSVFLYRVDFNKVMRGAWSAASAYDGHSHLPLDLHYLIIPWGENADHEHRIIGRAMQSLEDTPIFSGPTLDPITPWAPNESIQVCLEDLSTEDVMRTFDSLPLDYKLSIPYVARIAVIHGLRDDLAPRVSTTTSGTTPEVRGA